MEPTIFEIPIYRLSIEKHTSEMEKMYEKNLNNYGSCNSSEHSKDFRNYLSREVWYPWFYNEVIGYLRLYIFGTTLRVDYWSINKKRINKGITKKKFISLGKILELDIDRTQNSLEIFYDILNHLKELQHIRFKKRHFDLSTFKVVGRYIEWNRLVKDLNSFSNPNLGHKFLEE